MIEWLLTTALALSPAAPDAAAQVPSPAQIMAVPEPLRERLQAQVVDRSARGLPRLERLVDFMYQDDGLGIRYRHDANHTVAEIWRTREANCLAFTLLTIALARAAGLDAHGQEIARSLAWYSEGDILYFTKHVNAGIHIGRYEYTVDVGSENVLTNDPPQTIDDSRLLAIYYSNRAAELLAQGEPAAAAGHIEAALAADERYPTAWNNAGVLKLRGGQAAAAEQDFRRALQLDSLHDGALMNLASLYAARGDEQRADIYRERIEQARLGNPFHFFMLAVDAEKQGDYEAAAKHYRRAIRLHDGEHRFHFGLARAWLHLGDARRAGRELQRAHDLTEGDVRARYQAKLDVLRRRFP